MKTKAEAVSEDVQSKVEKYVFANYKSYVGKTLIVRETSNSFLVYKHEHGGPMILGKGILA